MKYLSTLILSFLVTLPTTLQAIDLDLNVGSKNFTEQLILGEMAAQYFEDRNVRVHRKLNLAGSHFTFEALKSKSIDLYPEYTGTGYITILKLKGETKPEIVLNIVQKQFQAHYQMMWSNPIGFNNTYVLAFKENNPKFKNLKNISDLGPILHDLKVGAPPEFFDRSDGFPGLLSSYSLSHPKGQQISLDPGLMYTAIKNEEVDIISAFSTDPRIAKYELKTLKDNLDYFPPYQAAWLVNESIYVKNEALFDAFFNDFKNLISDEEMRFLNAQVDEKQIDAKVVAQNFLSSKNLIQQKRVAPAQSNSFWSYMRNHQNDLKRWLTQHLILTGTALFFAFIVGFSIAIIVAQFQKLESILFNTLNVLQTIPSIALLGLLIPFLGIGTLPAIVALFFYSILPIARNTLTGIRSIDPKLLEVGQVMGMNTKDLFRYIHIPLALPFIVSGIRTATVICIGTATLAALIGAGGLGDPIFKGIGQANQNAILAGAIPAALLAIIADALLAILQHKLTPPHQK